MASQTALVTGATGFVGGNVARALHQSGVRVRALVRNGSDTLALDGVPAEIVEGDLGDREALRRAMEGCDVVFHAAALNTFWARDPSEFYRTNVGGTVNVLSAAVETGVPRVVYTGTWAVIRKQRAGEQATEETPYADKRDLTGHYRFTKYLAEREAMAFLDRGLDLVVVAPTVPVGPGDVKPTPSGRLILDFLLGRIPATVRAHLNLIDVEDVAAGHVLAWRKGRRGERYILGNRNMTLRDILGALASITGGRAPRLRVPVGAALAAARVDAFLEGVLLRRAPRIPLEGVLHARDRRAADSSKAIHELGLPQSPVEAALEKAVRWFRDHEYV